MNHFGVPELSPTEVKSRLETKDPVVLLDIREHDEVAMASIEGAVHIPMGELSARIKEVPQDKDVIVFCHHGSRSLMVAAQLKRRGYNHVMHMAGGIDQWSQQVDSSVPQYE